MQTRANSKKLIAPFVYKNAKNHFILRLKKSAGLKVVKFKLQINY